MRKWWLLGVAVIAVGYPLSYGIRPPSGADLIAAARGADRIVVVPSPMTTRDGRLDLLSFELHGEELVRELLQEIEIVPPETQMVGPFVQTKGFSCACDGDFHINIYRGESLR